MKLIINGKEMDANCKDIASLLSLLNLDKDTVAVELNKNIVHRQKFSATKLRDKDKVEIVTVVGGG